MGLFDLSGASDVDAGGAVPAGLMGMLANPQTAGLLGMASGLLASSGASRLPVTNGAALSNGFQGMQQGIGSAIQNQRGLMMTRAWNMLNGQSAPSGPTAPASASTQLPPVTGAANSGPMSGISAGLGSAAPSPATASNSAVSAYPGGAAYTGPMIFGMTPQQAFQRGLMMDMVGMQGGGDLMNLAAKYDPSLAYAMPTPQMVNAAAAYGQGTPGFTNAMRGITTKDATVALRPGAPFLSNGQIVTTPGAAPAGFMNNYDNNTGQWSVTPVAGGPEAVRGSAAASASGKAQYKLEEVWDQNANGGKGGFVQQTVSNVADAANGGAGGGSAPPPGMPAPVPGYSPFQNAIRAAESGGNAAAANPASSAQGSMQVVNGTAAAPGFGVQPAQNNSPAERARVGADYAAALRGKYGNDADAAIAYHYGPQVADQWIAGGRSMNMLPPDAPGYLSNVTSYSQAYAGGSAGPQSSSGPMAAQPPLGTQADATAQAQGQIATMNASYKEARQARATGQYALTMLDDMSNYAQTKSPALANKLYNVQGIFSSNAQLFDKSRDNLISQVSNSTGMSTDAARAIVEGAIPAYGMNSQAIQTGLGQIKGQVQMRMLKGDYLSDAYANGNAPAYNQRENQFDQMMTPAAAAIIKMPPGPARNQAIVAAKSNPQDAQALRWGLNVGLLR
jgi:hypothetical protein